MKLNILTIVIIITFACVNAQEKNVGLSNSYAPSSNKTINDNVDFESSNLPIVFINASISGLESEETIQGHMAIINNLDGRNNIDDRKNDYDRKVGISYVGKNIELFDKKSFLIETQRDNGDNFEAAIMGMPRENDWILYAPYSDKSLLRNSVTHELARSLGYYTSRIKYCELILNGKYHGIYMLMETIKKDENRLNLATLKEDDINGSELTGGYIFKVDGDWGLGYGWPAENIFHDAMDFGYQYVYPAADDIVDEQASYIRNTLSEFETVLATDDFNDPDIGYNKYIDVGSFVDKMLIYEITKSVNAFKEDMYFYKQKDTYGGKIFAGPLSDFTYAYANTDYWNLGLSTSGFAHADINRVMYWWYRFMHDKYFYDLVYTRWLALRQHQFSDEHIIQFMDSIVDHIDEAQQRNFEQWSILNTYVYPNSYIGEDYESEVQFLKDWILSRMAWMDNELFGTLLLPAASISNTTYLIDEDEGRAAIKVNLTDEYFNKNVLNKKFFNLGGLPNTVSIDTILFSNAAEAIIVLSANATPETVINELSLSISPEVLNGFEELSSNNLILSLNKQLINTELKVYAHKNELIVKCNRFELLSDRVEIFNAMGQLISTHPIHKQYVNKVYLNLPERVYIVKLYIGNSMEIRRITL